MGVVEWERNRLRQQEIEVKALVALIEHGDIVYRNEAQEQLFRIACPDLITMIKEDLELVDKNQTKLEYER